MSVRPNPARWRFALGLALLAGACGPASSVPSAGAPTPIERVITTTPQPPVVIVVTATPEATLVPPAATATTAACRKSDSLTAADAGETVAICGVIVEEGRLPCGSCPGEELHYIALKGGFQVISYDSGFFSGTGFSYEGTCVKVEDKVELLSGRPVLVFSRADGHGALPCKLKTGGGVVCDEEDYFTFLQPDLCY